MGRIITAKFISGSHFAQAFGNLWQYDYGAKLILEGLELPVAAEIHFASMECGGESETRIGVTTNGITEVKIPNVLLEINKVQDYNLYAFVYLTDEKSGYTEYKILMTVRARPKPGEEHPDTEKDHPLADAVQAVNAAADRAETAAGNAAESKAAAEDAAEQADKSRVAAETAAKHVADAGRTALTGIASAKTDAVETIETTKTGAVKAVDAARETAIKAVTDARTAAEQSLSEAKTDGVAAIETAKTSGVQAVEAVTAGIEQTKTSALEEIGSSKTAAVQAVETAENEGVAAVNAAVEAGKTNFVTDESLTLSGRAADAKVVGDELAKKADQTDLEYLRKRQNILVGSETGSRVCVTDAFEAPLEGLVLYGKSTQVTMTGAQLLNIPDAERTIRGVTLRIQNGVIEMNGTATEGGYAYVDIAKTPLTGVYTLSIDGAVKGALLDDKFQRLIESTASLNGKTARMLTFYITKDVKYSLTGIKVMLNAGDTALPWEPYTGGKPSPSPDYPQEIQSAKSEVVVHGKNLFGGRFYYANYSNEVLRIDETRNENEVKLPFAPTYETFGVCKVIKCQKGKTYVISVTNPNKNAAIGMAEYENIEKALNFNNALGFIRMNDKRLEKSYTAKSDGILVCGIAGSWTNGTTTLHECTESELLQVEEASEATDYEPYRTPQTITITSPTSLPGIPVSSDGNYTDDTGQQWICDEVDLERGVYVQRVYSIIVDGEDVTFSQAGRYCNMNLKKLPSAKSIIGTSQRIEARSTFTSETWNFNPEMGFLYLIKENYAETINESCKEHSGEVMYALAAPIEIPLSAADIAAYRALITYGPTTIVETDGAGIKLDYQRDVNIVIKQLTDTIASMTN